MCIPQPCLDEGAHVPFLPHQTAHRAQVGDTASIVLDLPVLLGYFLKLLMGLVGVGTRQDEEMCTCKRDLLFPSHCFCAI